MKNAKRWIALLLTSVMVMCLFSACGSSSSDTKTETKSETAAATETATETKSEAAAENKSEEAAAAATGGDTAEDEWGTYHVLSDSVEPITLVYGGNGGPTSIIWAASEFMSNLLAERSGGKITMEVHENSTISSTPIELYEGVLNGDIDLCNGSPGSTYIDDASACDLLMLFTDWDKSWKMWTDSAFRDKLNEMFEAQGAKLLFAYPKNFREYHGNVKLESLEDIKGVKFRLPGNTAWIDFWGGLGASPQSIAMNEVYTALSQGTVDAGENTLDMILNNNLLEVSDYLVLTHHYLDVIGMFMNAERYEGLDPEIRQLFDECLEAMDVWAAKTCVEFNERDTQAVLEAAEAADCEVVEMSDEFRQEMIEAASKQIDDVRAKSDTARELTDLMLEAYGYDY